jgi:branched-chain amino acid transport system permease protein
VIVAVVAAGLLGITWLALSRTRLGLRMRATQQDREMAQAFAIPVARIYTIAFGLGAALTAVAGALIVPVQQAHYLMGLDALLMSFVVVILGGLGSLRGTLVAALLVGLSDGVVSVLFSPTLAKIVATLLVGLVLAVRGRGLFGEETA